MHLQSNVIPASWVAATQKVQLFTPRRLQSNDIHPASLRAVEYKGNKVREHPFPLAYDLFIDKQMSPSFKVSFPNKPTTSQSAEPSNLQPSTMVQQILKPTMPITSLVIGVIVFDKVMLMDYVGTTSYLELLTDVCNVPIKVHTISQKKGPLRAVNGVPLYASVGYEDDDAPTKLDILLIPGGSPAGTIAMNKDREFLSYIHKLAHQTTYVLTVCTGSGILAHTGFLDGKRVTTNKMDFNLIADAHPAVNWVRKARWVVDGNIWTSSGVSAGMDMAYAFIASLYGSDAADMMAKIMEIEPSKDPANDPFAVVCS